MDWRNSFCILLLTVAACGQGDSERAVEFDPSKYDMECISHAGGNLTALRDCTLQDLSIWDGRLNSSYRSLMDAPGFPEEQKNALREAQRIWIDYVGAKCAVFCLDPADCGQAGRLQEAECRLEATIQRAEELQQMTEMFIDMP